MSALHAAAAELLPGATNATIKIVLRLLLDERRPEPTTRSIRIARPARAIRRRPKRRPAAPATPEWEELRHSVRTARREREVSYDELARTIGISVSTLKVTLFRHPPASQRVQAGLRAWLAQELEAAAVEPAATFRGSAPAGNGTSRAPAATAA
jgi:hypothetical protein